MKQIRGDTRKYYFQRKNANGEVITSRPDSLYFTVKKDYRAEDFLIQKTLDDMTLDEDGTYHFTIEPSDTDDLKYGSYVCDIQVTQDAIKTTILKDEFVIEEEVTFSSNEE